MIGPSHRADSFHRSRDPGAERSPITLPERTGANTQGYQGHDQFQMVESCLARRFPIDKSGLILRPTSVLKFG